MRVAVLGAGPGGLAVAVRLIGMSHDVRVWTRTKEKAEELSHSQLGLEDEEGRTSRVQLGPVSSQLQKTIDGTDLIVCAVPGNAQRHIIGAIGEHLTDSQCLLFTPGSAASLVAARHLADVGRQIIGRGLLVGETLALPQSARFTQSGRLRIKRLTRNRVAAFPSSRTPELLDRVGELFNARAAEHVLDTGIQNVNFIIHPAPMLLNYAEVERSNGKLSLMNEGMTEGVLRLMDGVDAEKLALCEAFGFKGTKLDDLYWEIGSSPAVYRERGEPFRLRDRVWSRYVFEDVPCGTVMFSELGRAGGVATPLSDSINAVFSRLEGRSFRAEGRTLERMGLAGMSVSQIQEYLHTGRRDS